MVRANGSYLWTRIQTPQHVWDQLRPREDSQIGFQELLGVVLVLNIFSSLLRSSLRVGFGDNDGVTYTLTKGDGHRMECNLVHFQMLVTHRFTRNLIYTLPEWKHVRT